MGAILRTFLKMSSNNFVEIKLAYKSVRRVYAHLLKGSRRRPGGDLLSLGFSGSAAAERSPWLTDATLRSNIILIGRETRFPWAVLTLSSIMRLPECTAEHGGWDWWRRCTYDRRRTLREILAAGFLHTSACSQYLALPVR